MGSEGADKAIEVSADREVGSSEAGGGAIQPVGRDAIGRRGNGDGNGGRGGHGDSGNGANNSGRDRLKVKYNSASGVYKKRALEIQKAIQTRDAFNVSGEKTTNGEPNASKETQSLYDGLMLQAAKFGPEFLPTEQDIVSVSQNVKGNYTYLTTERLEHILAGDEGERENKFKKYTHLKKSTQIVDVIMEASKLASATGEPGVVNIEFEGEEKKAQIRTVLSKKGNGWIVTAMPREIE